MCTLTARPAISVFTTVHRFPNGGLDTSATDSIPGTPRSRASSAHKVCPRGGRCVAAQGRIDGNHLPVIEARIGVNGMIHGPHQKPGHDQQDATGRDLRSYKELPGDGASRPPAGGLPGRRQPKQDRRREPHPGGKRYDPPHPALDRSTAEGPPTRIRIRRTT